MVKKLIYSTITGIFVFTLLYLLASFYSVTFDISKWDKDTRALLSIIGGMFGAISMVIAFAYNENN
jgi:hypothetical protein